MREIVYTMICVSPIKQEDKPTKDQIMKLSIDEKKDDKPKKRDINNLEKKLKS